jgi:uncharacterized protein YecE (DUF72 family)
VAVLIGTSGWQYKHWKDRFYPARLPQKKWLEHYADRFDTVESNAAFYMLPKPQTFEDWARRTPDSFVMAVKVNRYITHIRRLRDAEEPAKRFTDHVKCLGPKLGPVLVQLPPSLRANFDALASTLDSLGRDVRIAVEFRHASWFTEEARELLTRRGAALCMADRRSAPITPLWRTADWTYLRFHEGRASPHPCYGRTSLKTWAERLAAQWGRNSDVFVYFNNDGQGCALRDARSFAREVERVGLPASRVPREVVAVG